MLFKPFDQIQRLSECISLLNKTVLDVGAGHGAYTKILCEQVGDRGSVIALDIDKELVESLDVYKKNNHTDNLVTLWTDIEHHATIRLKKESIDVVVVCHTLYQLTKPHHGMDVMMALLKKGGYMLITEWSDEKSLIGPKPHYTLSKKDIAQILSPYDISIVSEKDNAPYQYEVIVKKN
jgi:ubiquinone/menaquinone biosynthesis C-methylase UbiE